MWFVTSYEAAASVLRSPAFRRGEGATMVSQDPRYGDSVVRRFLTIELLNDDPPMREACDLGPNPRGPLSVLVALREHR
jgi:hypothetical protein